MTNTSYEYKRVGLIVLSFAILPTIASLPFIQCLGDDTFIYMRMINNFLATGRFEYNPGEPCYAMTSLVWFLSWAGATRIFGQMDTARYVLSFVSHLLAVIGIVLILKRLVRRPLVQCLVLTGVFFDPFYLRWYWAGWESSPKIAAAAFALAVTLHKRSRLESVSHTFLVGLVAAIGILTRPEMIALALLCFGYLAASTPRRKGWHLLAYVGGLAALLLPWELYAWKTFGWLVPHTVLAKSHSVFLAYLKYALPRLFYIVIVPGLPIYGLAAMALAGIALSKDVSHRAVAEWSRDDLLDWFLVALWGLTVAGFMVSGNPIESIKTCLFAPFLVTAAGMLVDRFWPNTLKARVWIGGAIVASVALSFAMQAGLYYRFAIWNRKYRQGEDSEFIAFAKEVGTRTPPDARVGLSELGVIGYYSGRYIIDFVGLATPKLVSYKRRYGSDGIRRYLTECSGWPEYIVSPIRSSSLPTSDVPVRIFYGVPYERVYSRDVRRIGGGEPRHEFSRYILYKRIDSPDAARNPGPQE